MRYELPWGVEGAEAQASESLTPSPGSVVNLSQVTNNYKYGERQLSTIDLDLVNPLTMSPLVSS